MYFMPPLEITRARYSIFEVKELLNTEKRVNFLNDLKYELEAFTERKASKQIKNLSRFIGFIEKKPTEFETFIKVINAIYLPFYLNGLLDTYLFEPETGTFYDDEENAYDEVVEPDPEIDLLSVFNNEIIMQQIKLFSSYKKIKGYSKNNLDVVNHLYEEHKEKQQMKAKEQKEEEIKVIDTLVKLFEFRNQTKEITSRFHKETYKKQQHYTTIRIFKDIYKLEFVPKTYYKWFDKIKKYYPKYKDLTRKKFFFKVTVKEIKEYVESHKRWIKTQSRNLI